MGVTVSPSGSYTYISKTDVDHDVDAGDLIGLFNQSTGSSTGNMEDDTWTIIYRRRGS